MDTLRYMEDREAIERMAFEVMVSPWVEDRDSVAAQFDIERHRVDRQFYLPKPKERKPE